MYRIINLALFSFIVIININSQSFEINLGKDTSNPRKIVLGAFVDVYYGNFLFYNSPNNELPYFVSSNKNNQVNLNVAYLNV